jgi:hypothetical protein
MHCTYHDLLCCHLHLPSLQERKSLRNSIIALTDRGTTETRLPPAPQSPGPVHRYHDDQLRQRVGHQGGFLDRGGGGVPGEVPAWVDIP